MRPNYTLPSPVPGRVGGNARPPYDLVCLSHLLWDFVWQRPQQLLSRCARERRVYFVEEPVLGSGAARLDVSPREDGVTVVVPQLAALDGQADAVQELLLRELLLAETSATTCSGTTRRWRCAARARSSPWRSSTTASTS